MFNLFYFMHESSGNTDGRVFGCPRIKRGAPDLLVSQAGWLMKPLVDKSISLVANNVELIFNGGDWADI